MLTPDTLEARAFLEEYQEQPEGVRRIFLYVVCQTMVQAGLLEFKGAFSTPYFGITLIYRNPDTGEIIEIARPEMTDDEAREIRTHILELLEENARAA